MAKRGDGGNSNGEVRQCFERPGYSIDLICNGLAMDRKELQRGETAWQGMEVFRVVKHWSGAGWLRQAAKCKGKAMPGNVTRGLARVSKAKGEAG